MKKYCGACKENKDVKDFHKSARRKDGLSTQCKNCSLIRGREWYKKNKSRKLAIGATYYSNNREKVINATLIRKYGITLNTYNIILNEQGYVCAICGEPEKRIEKRTGFPYALCVDHCHETNVVRGLLCRSCNYTLGYFGDNLQGALKLVKYLEKSLCVQ